MNKPNLKLIHSNDSFNVVPGLDPLIAEGVYQCKLEYWETVKPAMFCNAQKLILHFSIIDMGEHFGTKLRAFYNVKINGKPTRKGGFTPPPRGKFMFDYCSCFPDFRINRSDRIPMSFLQKAIIKCKVVTVKKNYKQAAYPQALKHSIVERMAGIA